jgi:hypothetical protein
MLWWAASFPKIRHRLVGFLVALVCQSPLEKDLAYSWMASDFSISGFVSFEEMPGDSWMSHVEQKF